MRIARVNKCNVEQTQRFTWNAIKIFKYPFSQIYHLYFWQFIYLHIHIYVYFIYICTCMVYKNDRIYNYVLMEINPRVGWAYGPAMVPCPLSSSSSSLAAQHLLRGKIQLHIYNFNRYMCDAIWWWWWWWLVESIVFCIIFILLITLLCCECVCIIFLWLPICFNYIFFSLSWEGFYGFFLKDFKRW